MCGDREATETPGRLLPKPTVKDLSFSRGGVLVQMRRGSLNFMLPKRGHQKLSQLKLGFGEDYTIFCKHCCSLKIDINKQIEYTKYKNKNLCFNLQNEPTGN